MPTTINGTTGVSQIQDDTVTSAKIVNGTIAPADLTGGQSGSAPIYGCRAWCVFDGTVAGTNAPTAGGNVTSVTRVSTGVYTINFTTAIQDANYATVFTAGVSGAASATYLAVSTPQTTTSVTVASVVPSTTAAQDTKVCCIAIFR